MKRIENASFPMERALYNQKNLDLVSCRFEGEEDGESALKECENITLSKCYMDLRYPLWHDKKVRLDDVMQTPNCRAALWYSEDIEIVRSQLNGIKALRECENIKIKNSTIDSPEFGWKSRYIEIYDTKITSEYIFMNVHDFKAKDSTFNGKYGFQYWKMWNLTIVSLILKMLFGIVKM